MHIPGICFICDHMLVFVDRILLHVLYYGDLNQYYNSINLKYYYEKEAMEVKDEKVIIHVKI